LAIQAGPRDGGPALKSEEALSLRRYHLRKRNVKPMPIMASIIRFPVYCLSDFWDAKRPLKVLAWASLLR
jgi:hypothetical protein